MSYGSIADFANYGVPAAGTTNITTAQIQAQLDRASAIMDTYFRHRWTLPVVSWGADVSSWCCTLAAWGLLSSIRGFNPEGDQNVVVKQRVDHVTDLLEQVKGRKHNPSIVGSEIFATKIFYASNPLSKMRGW